MELQAADPLHVAAAAARIVAGGLVAFPTETVYGLGADATNGLAVARIYAAKGRPQFNPLIAHVANRAEAERLACFDAMSERLAAAFWPGPLTLVLHRRAGCPVSDLVTAGLDTLAVRVPADPVAQALLRQTGRPIAAPSANRSGRVSATEARHVAEDFADVDGIILDGGPARHGLESTIVMVADGGLRVLRPGAVTVEQLARVVGDVQVASGAVDRPSAPGQLESHYAPRALLRLNASDVQPGEALLAFGRGHPATVGPMLNLSPAGDVVEAAANLFTMLRQLDATGAERIAVAPIPALGLGLAIDDRLRRAAAPRPSQRC